MEELGLRLCELALWSTYARNYFVYRATFLCVVQAHYLIDSAALFVI